MNDSSRMAGLADRLLARKSNLVMARHRGDYRFNTISVLALVVFLAIGMGLQGTLGEMPDSEEIGVVVAGVFGAGVILLVFPFWPLVLAAVGACWATLPIMFEADMTILAACLTVAFLLSPGLEVVSQWDKIVVLRLGKFHKVRGPGLLLLFPLLDRVAGYVDTRIRATDFSAEKSLTRDTVPVHVDALAFWMIWDAGKAVLEVQDFESAVTLSAQTALRASIGANDLSTLLSERERLGEEIQKIVDAKTNPWGITILSVEFKEILIPKELEDALSRQAQASREKSARVILGSAEEEIAHTFKSAADHYRDDPVALQLRAMNMIYESMRNKGGLVLVPASALESMNLGTVLGTKVYADKQAASDASGTTSEDGLTRHGHGAPPPDGSVTQSNPGGAAGPSE